MLAFPLESPVVATSEPARETQEVIPDDVAPPAEAKRSAVRGPSRWDVSTVTRLSKLVIELEWAILAEALPAPEEIDPLTATFEVIKAYLARHPRLGRPLPR